VIVQVDGKTIDATHPLSVAINEHKPGDTVQLTIVRSGQTITVSVVLGEKNNDAIR
jgi:serine protease Do